MEKLKISLASFIAIFAFKISHAQNTAGDNLLNNLQVHTIQINFSQGGYLSILSNNKVSDDANGTSTYISAQVVVDGNPLDSVGVQFKGNSSYYNYPGNKKPFTLVFNNYDTLQRYDGLKAINLNNFYQDPTFMREKLFLDFLNAKGMYGPRANYTKVYLNGNYWGLYLMVERIGSTFLKDRFGNKQGNLFKGDASSSACANLKYLGSNQTSYYNCYTLKTNTTANNWNDLINLTAQINNTTNLQFKDSVDRVLDANSFIGSWAACNLFADFDSYSFRYQHNYYIYHDTIADKFKWITWDVSTAFGMDIPLTINQIENLSVLYLTPPATNKPLSNRMLSDVTYKDTYLKYVCSYANNDFLPAVLNPKIDNIKFQIQNDVYADVLKMYSNQNFDDNIIMDVTINSVDYAGLKPFIAYRSASALGELNTLGYTNCPGIYAGISNAAAGNNFDFTVFPNPFSSEATLQYTLLKNENVSVKVYDVMGRETSLLSKIKQSAGTYEIPFNVNSQYSEGIYFVKFSTETNVGVKKVIITK